jgi:hypothetical protein
MIPNAKVINITHIQYVQTGKNLGLRTLYIVQRERGEEVDVFFLSFFGLFVYRPVGLMKML